MQQNTYSVITGTGRYIPSQRVDNESFLSHTFYSKDGQQIDKDNREILEKFHAITTIEERRYVTPDLVTSDIAFFAAEAAIASAGIDKEDLDYVIVAHNFGDVRIDRKTIDIVPSLAARVKSKLQIKSPEAVAYDLPFGCPGWLQGVIQADYYIKSGDAKKALVVGAEVLSRVVDPHDRDSLLYGDGAGAVIMEAQQSADPVGVIKHRTRSDTFGYAEMLFMGASYHTDNGYAEDLFLKMHGRKLYQYALEKVPQAIKNCLDASGRSITEVRKLLIHQANGKMDEAILKRLFGLYGIKEVPKDVMPMTISWLGNSSVATVPTLLDLILTGGLQPHAIDPGDLVVFASVGAGMNINALIYQF